MRDPTRSGQRDLAASGLGAGLGGALRPARAPGDVQLVPTRPLRLRFWGVRGTLPVPGYRSLEYGGNTSCVGLDLPDGELFVFDAGSGIRELSAELGRRAPRRGRIFISHPHWDHISAIPFFAPLYRADGDFEILGPPQGSRSMRDLVAAQMDGVYFPITIREFGPGIRFRDLDEGSLQIGGAEVATMRLAHPGCCLGYRVRCEGRTVCYVTDNELFPRSSARHSAEYERRLADFVRGADALITDTTYSDEEYAGKEGWGHSGVSRVAELAHRAEVRTLYLFHHDPDQTDEDIERKHATCRSRLDEWESATECLAPKERDEVLL